MRIVYEATRRIEVAAQWLAQHEPFVLLHHFFALGQLFGKDAGTVLSILASALTTSLSGYWTLPASAGPSIEASALAVRQACYRTRGQEDFGNSWSLRSPWRLRNRRGISPRSKQEGKKDNRKKRQKQRKQLLDYLKKLLPVDCFHTFAIHGIAFCRKQRNEFFFCHLFSLRHKPH